MDPIVIAFIVGYVIGMFSELIILYIIGKRQAKIYKAQLDKLTKEIDMEAKKVEESQMLIVALQAIITKQQTIGDELEKPSANAEHSKHKNGLLQEYKQLEIDKIKIMETMVEEKGIDFAVRVRKENGEVITMKISELLEKAKELNRTANDMYEGYEEEDSAQVKLRKLADEIKQAAMKNGTKHHKGGIKQHGKFFVIDGEGDLDEQLKGWDDDDDGGTC